MRGWEPRIQRGDAAEKRAVRSSQAQVSATWPRSHTSTGPGHRCRLETRPGTLATRESRLLDDFPVTKPRPTPCEVSSFRGLIGLVCVSHHSCVRLRAAPRTVAHQAPPSRDSPGKNTGAGCRVLLQGNFPTQGSNSCLLHLLP